MANTKKASATEAKKIDFEASMQRLEEIVSTLEKGKVGLDGSMKLYEEAIYLARECNAALDTAEQKVKILRLAGAEGVELLDFEGSEND